MSLYLVWKASGADPFRTYNGLDDRYKPLSDPDAPARPPQFPERVKAFVYACGAVAREQELQDLKLHANAVGQAVAKAMG